MVRQQLPYRPWRPCVIVSGIPIRTILYKETYIGHRIIGVRLSDCNFSFIGISEYRRLDLANSRNYRTIGSGSQPIGLSDNGVTKNYRLTNSVFVFQGVFKSIILQASEFFVSPIFRDFRISRNLFEPGKSKLYKKTTNYLIPPPPSNKKILKICNTPITYPSPSAFSEKKK